MTDDELQAHLRTLRDNKTDHRHVEAKTAKTDLPKRLWETLSSFSNSKEGGIILLGVDEREGFAVTGVDDPAKLQAHLQSMCTEMDPQVAATIDLKRVENKSVIVAEIPELLPNQKPCFHKATGMANGTYIRQGDADRKLGQYEIQMLLSARTHPEYDKEPVEDASVDDLDPRATAAFLHRVKERRLRFRDRNDTDILTALKVLVPSQRTGAVVPSIAGLLCFGREPQAHFPQFAVLLSVFPGPKLGQPGPGQERLLDDARIEGNISHMVSQTISRLVSNMKHMRREAGSARSIDYELPLAALSEALVNALAHRDFSPLARGTAVQVHLYSDRLEIINPGGLFGPVNVDGLGIDGQTSARNTILMQLLEDAVDPDSGTVIAEHRGTGVAAMIESLRKAGISPPTFDDKISSFRVTIPRQSLIDAETLKWMEKLGPRTTGLSPDQRAALAMMRSGEEMTNERFRQVSGVDSRVATRELAELVENGLITPAGGGRWRSYILNSREEAALPDSTRRARADRRPEIRRLLAERGELSRAEIQQLVNLGQGALNNWLRRMVVDGEIERTSPFKNDPKAKYRLSRR